MQKFVTFIVEVDDEQTSVPDVLDAVDFIGRTFNTRKVDVLFSDTEPTPVMEPVTDPAPGSCWN